MILDWKLAALWAPSQKGFFAEWPHRQSANCAGFAGVIGLPAMSFRTTPAPLTLIGPLSMIVISAMRGFYRNASATCVLVPSAGIVTSRESRAPFASVAVIVYLPLASRTRNGGP